MEHSKRLKEAQKFPVITFGSTKSRKLEFKNRYVWHVCSTLEGSICHFCATSIPTYTFWVQLEQLGYYGDFKPEETTHPEGRLICWSCLAHLRTDQGKIPLKEAERLLALETFLLLGKAIQKSTLEKYEKYKRFITDYLEKVPFNYFLDSVLVRLNSGHLLVGSAERELEAMMQNFELKDAVARYSDERVVIWDEDYHQKFQPLYNLVASLVSSSTKSFDLLDLMQSWRHLNWFTEEHIDKAQALIATNRKRLELKCVHCTHWNDSCSIEKRRENDLLACKHFELKLPSK